MCHGLSHILHDQKYLSSKVLLYNGHLSVHLTTREDQLQLLIHYSVDDFWIKVDRALHDTATWGFLIYQLFVYMTHMGTALLPES
jgi:hypothetical protein